jgi:GntR family transcriptional regulator, L-lactate dehydrogenase operon regulator
MLASLIEPPYCLVIPISNIKGGFMKITNLSDWITDKLELMISTQGLKIGDRLPSERKLALELGVSRTSIREAIQKLISRGQLLAKQGGGTFVHSSPNDWKESAIVDPLKSLFKDNPEYRFDVLEIRHALEGCAAWHAAQRASEEDKIHIKKAFDKMVASHNGDDALHEAHLDAQFHLSIAEASHNIVLLQVMRGLFDLLQANVAQNLEKLYIVPRVFEPLTKQHQNLMEAVLNGDPEAARNASDAHIGFVHSSLRSFDEDEARFARSLRLPI